MVSVRLVRPSVPIEFPRRFISVNLHNCTYEFPRKCISVNPRNCTNEFPRKCISVVLVLTHVTVPMSSHVSILVLTHACITLAGAWAGGTGYDGVNFFSLNKFSVRCVLCHIAPVCHSLLCFVS